MTLPLVAYIYGRYRLDIAWWIVFLPTWNHKSMITGAQVEGKPTVVIASDASGSWGCGAWWNSAWFQVAWTEEWASVSIAAKELIILVLASAVWGP